MNEPDDRYPLNTEVLLRQTQERLHAVEEENDALRAQLEHSNMVLDKLRDREAILRAVFDNAPSIIYLKDRDGRHLLVNREFTRVLKVNAEQVSGKTAADLFPSDVAGEMMGNDQVVLDRGKAMTFEEVIQEDNTGHPFISVKFPLYDAGGAIYGVGGISTDITEQKCAEERIERERAFLSAVIEVLPIALLFVSPDQELIRANHASSVLFRHPDWRHWSDVSWLTPNHVAVPQEQWPIMRALRDKETLTNIEGIIRYPDGDEVPILHQVAPVFVRDELVAAIAVFQDISELKAADRAKDQFLMLLSHELKTPLTNIIGYGEMAQDAQEMAVEAIEVILRNAKAQRQMLERLIILARILTGRLTLQCESIDLWQLVIQVIEEQQVHALQHEITVELEPPEGVLPVNADRKLIKQAVSELLVNALQFTSSGGSVTVSGCRQQGWIVLVICDTGRGIAPDELPRLLKPFEQIQRDEILGGLGIGLALVRGIMEQHGGRVVIFSPGIGHGTTARLELPHTISEASKTNSH